MTTTSNVRGRTEEDPVWRAAYFAGVERTFEIDEMLLVLVKAYSQSKFVAIRRAMNNGKSILVKSGFNVSRVNEQDKQGLLVHDTRIVHDGQKFNVQIILSIPKP